VEVIERVAASGDGEDFCVDGPCAGDVERGVADDEDIFATQFAFQDRIAAVAGDGGNLASVFMIVSKTAGDEMFPEIVMGQLDLRSQADVAGEQSYDGRLGHSLQARDQFGDAGEHASSGLAEQVIEPKNVAVVKAVKVFVAGFNLIPLEKFPDDGGVSAPRETQAGGAVRNLELGRTHAGECFYARSTAFDESAVDVK